MYNFSSTDPVAQHVSVRSLSDFRTAGGASRVSLCLEDQEARLKLCWTIGNQPEGQPDASASAVGLVVGTVAVVVYIKVPYLHHVIISALIRHLLIGVVHFDFASAICSLTGLFRIVYINVPDLHRTMQFMTAFGVIILVFVRICLQQSNAPPASVEHHHPRTNCSRRTPVTPSKASPDAAVAR